MSGDEPADQVVSPSWRVAMSKKPGAVSQFAGVISGTLMFFLVLAGLTYGPRIGVMLHARGIPAWLIILALPMGFLTLVGLLMKWGIQKALPTEFGFEAVHPASYPKLDAEAFTRYHDALTRLGFVWIIDYTLTSTTSALPPAFARLLVHPQHHCFAEINQAFPDAGGRMPVRCVLGSLFNDGWSFGTTDRTPDGPTWMLRRPKSLWHSLPNASPEAMLQSHLESRSRIGQQLGQQPRTDLDFDAYFVHEQGEARDRAATFRRKNFLVALCEMLFFPLRRRYEWMGALRKR